ncbi:MAG: folylpolyglutamate synthase/dihydrofolate synthase family protein [Thermodesulfovibrionia bacterium]|nr:folylpolyglutamate synthase/dihydrofolate synthase family protein [Thermodesulfovibrionia bacterium]
MLTDPEIYSKTVNYLYDLQKHGVKLGLSNIERLTDILEKPQNSFRSIHIAGTNGKGSTTTMIASILRTSGWKVGMFTSPHLKSFTERIRVNGIPISESDVVSLTHKIRESFAGTDLNPTFFEVVTALAFCYFSLHKVDWAVIETGMGGRFDATNIIHPELSIITNIDIDHAEYLGDSISAISHEKAGIIKQGVPVITGARQPEAIMKLSDTAEMNNSAIHIYGKDFTSSPVSADLNRQFFDYKGYRTLKNISLNLSGSYQTVNASLAIRAVEILNNSGEDIDDTSVRTSLTAIDIEGRLEVVSEAPFIILDSAHNPEASRRLSSSLKELFPDKKITIIIGIMKDKDIAGILKPILEISDSIILTRPEGERAASPEEINNKVTSLIMNNIANRHVSVTLTDSVSEALETAKKMWLEDSIICVTGSFYTTGKVKELLGNKGILSGLRE